MHGWGGLTALPRCSLALGVFLDLLHFLLHQLQLLAHSGSFGLRLSDLFGGSGRLTGVLRGGLAKEPLGPFPELANLPIFVGDELVEQGLFCGEFRASLRGFSLALG